MSTFSFLISFFFTFLIGTFWNVLRTLELLEICKRTLKKIIFLNNEGLTSQGWSSILGLCRVFSASTGRLLQKAYPPKPRIGVKQSRAYSISVKRSRQPTTGLSLLTSRHQGWANSVCAECPRPRVRFLFLSDPSPLTDKRDGVFSISAECSRQSSRLGRSIRWRYRAEDRICAERTAAALAPYRILVIIHARPRLFLSHPWPSVSSL